MTSKSVNFLLVEDDEVDIQALKRAFSQMKISNPVVIANNGLEALDCLRGENGREKLQQPYLILLDLNMPKMNGLEFLQALRADAELKKSIVFVLTTSNDEQDRLQAYDLNVAGYIVKADASNSFKEAVGFLNMYWNLVEFPA